MTMGPLRENDPEARPSAGEPLQLRLYITGQSPNSIRALANLQSICEELLGVGQYELEVVDILLDPLRAVNDQIIVTPTLVKLPLPSVQIVGDLGERDKVMLVLKLFCDSR
jgi:circadian clock protein KaiB